MNAESGRGILEGWFAGGHSGTACHIDALLILRDTEEHACRTPHTRWMVSETVKSQCHIHFDTRIVRFHLAWRGVEPSSLHWFGKRTQVLAPAPVHPGMKAGERFLRYRPSRDCRMPQTLYRSGFSSLSLPTTSGRMNRVSTLVQPLLYESVETRMENP